MVDESVIFEIQVEKKVLEQVFNENQHLKESYDKLIKNEDAIKELKEQITELKNNTKNLQEINKNLNDENTKLKTKIEELEQIQRRNEEEKKASELNETESKLLKLKLEQLENEKNKLTEEYKNEKKILEKRNSLEELHQLKKRLLKLEAENKKLDQDNLDLETELKNINRKLRLEEERNKSNDLAHAECKLLKLKLHTLENEKNYLISDFERERKIITKQSKPRVQKLEENLRLLRKWVEKETRERRPRDTDQVKSLKAQIASLENDKNDLIEGFELERKVFRKILKNNGCHDELA